MEWHYKIRHRSRRQCMQLQNTDSVSNWGCFIFAETKTETIRMTLKFHLCSVIDEYTDKDGAFCLYAIICICICICSTNKNISVSICIQTEVGVVYTPSHVKSGKYCIFQPIIHWQCHCCAFKASK